MIDRSFAFDGGERNGEDNKKKRRKEGEEKRAGGEKRFRFLGCHSILHPMDSPSKSCFPLSPSPPSPHVSPPLLSFPPPLPFSDSFIFPHHHNHLSCYCCSCCCCCLRPANLPAVSIISHSRRGMGILGCLLVA